MHTEHRALLNSWKWGVILDCPVVLIALDYSSNTSITENIVKKLFEQHACLVPSGQVAVTSFSDYSSWRETRGVKHAIECISPEKNKGNDGNNERSKALLSKIGSTFKNREMTPFAHLITSSDNVCFDTLKSFEGNLIFHIHQIGSYPFTLPTDLPSTIEIRHTVYTD